MARTSTSSWSQRPVARSSRRAATPHRSIRRQCVSDKEESSVRDGSLDVWRKTVRNEIRAQLRTAPALETAGVEGGAAIVEAIDTLGEMKFITHADRLQELTTAVNEQSAGCNKNLGDVKENIVKLDLNVKEVNKNLGDVKGKVAQLDLDVKEVALDVKEVALAVKEVALAVKDLEHVGKVKDARLERSSTLTYAGILSVVIYANADRITTAVGAEFAANPIKDSLSALAAIVCILGYIQDQQKK